MSNNPPPRQKGPLETRVAALWVDCLNAYDNATPHAHFASQAAAEILAFRNALQPGNQASANDLYFAEAEDRFKRESLAAHAANLEGFRSQMRSMLDFTLKQVATFNQFAFQSLSLANGAIVLATLGYIGREGAGPPERGLLVVILLCALGFLLTLLSAHIGTLLSTKSIQLYSELAQPTLPVAGRIEKLKRVPDAAKLLTRWPRFLSYVAAGCLVVALAIGTITLSERGAANAAASSGPPGKISSGPNRAARAP